MRYKRRSTCRRLQRLARFSTTALLVALLFTGAFNLSSHTSASTLPPEIPAVHTPTRPPSLAPPTMPTPTPTPTPTPSAYDFTAPVPDSTPVEDSWFSDAAFVGDSRTEGLILYGTLRTGGSFAYRGLTVQSARTDKVVSSHGQKRTAIDALGQDSYGKVYLSLGINELGWYNNKRYYENYAALVDLVRAAQPDAQIYLETLIPVTAEKSAASYINNPQILVYNEIIRKVAAEKEVYLLDVYAAFVDKKGTLPVVGSVDGVHLTKAYYAKWCDYLKAHTVIE